MAKMNYVKNGFMDYLRMTWLYRNSDVLTSSKVTHAPCLISERWAFDHGKNEVDRGIAEFGRGKSYILPRNREILTADFLVFHRGKRRALVIWHQ